MQFYSLIKGLSFRPAEDRDIAHSLQRDDKITLVRDPTNAWDRNAIKALAGETFIGFLAKEDAAAIAYQIDNGKQFSASVVSVYEKEIEVIVSDAA